VVAYVEGDTTTPPRELALCWQIEQFHTLPFAGGLLEQPAGLMNRVNAAGNIYRAYNAWYKPTPPMTRIRFMNDNPWARPIIAAAWQARKTNSG
jgi:hypothetical protein